MPQNQTNKDNHHQIALQILNELQSLIPQLRQEVLGYKQGNNYDKEKVQIAKETGRNAKMFCGAIFQLLTELDEAIED